MVGPVASEEDSAINMSDGGMAGNQFSSLDEPQKNTSPTKKRPRIHREADETSNQGNKWQFMYKSVAFQTSRALKLTFLIYQLWVCLLIYIIGFPEQNCQRPQCMSRYPVLLLFIYSRSGCRSLGLKNNNNKKPSDFPPVGSGRVVCVQVLPYLGLKYLIISICFLLSFYKFLFFLISTKVSRLKIVFFAVLLNHAQHLIHSPQSSRPCEY